MRILQVLDKAAHDGGVAVHVAALADALRSRGHDVETLRLHHPGRPPPASAPGDSLRLPYTYGRVASWRHAPALRALLAAWPPELVHVHAFTTLSATLLARTLARIPVVGTVHDTRPFCFHMTRRFVPTGQACTRTCGSGCFTSGCVRPQGAVDWVRMLRRWRIDGINLRRWQRFDRVVVPSTYLAELARRHGFAPDRLRVVPHGTPIVEIGRPPAADAAPPRIVYLGALVDYKGVEVLLEALAVLRERSWRAVFAGAGPLRESLSQALARAGLDDRVEFVGPLTKRREVQLLLAGARLLVLPSIVPEAFGLAGLEALAAGTPVVSFGLGGVTEWLRPGENGLCALPCQARDLARQIARLLDDPVLAARLGANGRALARQRFDEERAMDALGAVYAELVDAPPGPPRQ